MQNTNCDIWQASGVRLRFITCFHAGETKKIAVHINIFYDYASACDIMAVYIKSVKHDLFQFE